MNTNTSLATTTTPEAIVQQQAERAQKRDALARIKAYAHLQEIQEHFTNLLGAREGKQYVESVLIAVANSEDLQKCSPRSIMIQAMRAASLHLSVDPILKQAHLVPFGGEAVLIADYHGLLHLSEETGYYSKPPYVSAIYAGEELEFERISGRLVGIKGEAVKPAVQIGWLGYFQAKNGVERWEYWTNEQCDAWGQKYNPRGFGSKKSAWATHRDDMRRKTVLRNLLTRWGNFAPHVQRFIESQETVDAEVFDMPSDENIEPEVREPKSREQNLAELGFGPSPVKPSPSVQHGPEWESVPEPEAPPEQTEPEQPEKMIDPTSRPNVAYAAIKWQWKPSEALTKIQGDIKSGRISNPVSARYFRAYVTGIPNP